MAQGHLFVSFGFSSSRFLFFSSIFVFLLISRSGHIRSRNGSFLQIRAGRETGGRQYDGAAHGPGWGRISLSLSTRYLLFYWAARLRLWLVGPPCNHRKSLVLGVEHRLRERHFVLPLILFLCLPFRCRQVPGHWYHNVTVAVYTLMFEQPSRLQNLAIGSLPIKLSTVRRRAAPSGPSNDPPRREFPRD